MQELTFNQVANILQGIAKISSTNEKKAMLKQYDSEMLRRVLEYALNPYKTYGVVNMEIQKIGNASIAKFKVDGFFTFLNSLASRQLTGNDARLAITDWLEGNTLEEQQLLLNILKKDLRCGVGTTLANKVFPGLIPTFECMLASPSGDIKYPCAAEPKFDGVRCLAFVENGVVTYYSRNGKVFDNFHLFNEEILSLPSIDGMILDGEVIGTSFNELMTQARRKNNIIVKKLNYVIFDILPIETFRVQGKTIPYDDRKQHIRSLFFNKKFKYLRSTINTLVKGEQQLGDFYNLIVADGYEGIIIKDLNAPYEFKRSKAWIKQKPTDTIDVPVVGIEEGTGKYKGMLGALIVDVDGVQVNVGTGFSDKQRKELFDNYNEFPDGSPNPIAEIKFQEKTPDGSLRFPVFVQFRPDKEIT